MSVPNPIEVFYAYAQEDEDLRVTLEKHLSLLRTQALITSWHEQLVYPGSNRNQEITKHLERASVILLLISADFLASGYCFGVEMQRALERQAAKEAWVMPILLREVDWQDAPFAHLQILPTNAKPITSWRNRDAAFVNVATGIRRAIENLPLLVASAPPTTLPAVWNIPYSRNAFFLGREGILSRLHTQLQAGQALALSQPQAINGLGGIGKTQIAVEYAYRHRSMYQAILWVQSDTRDNLISSFTSIAQLLHLPVKEEEDKNIIIQSVMQWLRRHGAWLLIFDNADDLEIVRDFIPATFEGHVILTTRAQAMGRLALKIEVEIMSPEEGALFLLRRSGIIKHDAGLDDALASEWEIALELVQELGGVPLALDQAGAYIEETECGICGYLQEYRKHKVALLDRRGGFVKDHPASVATTWSLSFEKIERANPASADLLRLCAFLAPDAIPEEMITLGAKYLGLHLQAAIADRRLFDGAIQALRTYSLIRRNISNKHLNIHRLVQVVLKERMDEKAYRIWAGRAIYAVNEVFPSPKLTEWEQCERYISNALVCATLIEQQSITLLEAACLLTNAGRYLKARGRYDQAEPLLQQALTIRVQRLGSEHLDTAESLNNLGSLYHSRGKYVEAERLLQQALTIREQQLGADHLVTAISLNDLADLYHTQRRDGEAERLLQRALSIREQLLGSDHLDTATILSDLGNVFYTQGKNTLAESLLQRALKIRERQLGPEHPTTAASLSRLAFFYHRQGKDNEAEPLLRRAATLQEHWLGSEHSATIQSLNILGNICRLQGKYEEAELLLRRTLVAREHLLGPEHLATTMSMASLANLYDRQKRYAEAEMLYVRVLEIRERQLGLEHPYVATSLNSLGDFFFRQGKYAEAENFLQQSLAIRRKRLSPDHPATAVSLHSLARLYNAQEKYVDAEQFYIKVLTVREQRLGLEHPDTILAAKEYSDFLRREHRIKDAELLEARIPYCKTMRQNAEAIPPKSLDER
jgi:tetratricopeptide (TPR) repeat protein